MIREKYLRTIISTLPTSWLLQLAFVFYGTPAQAIPVVAPIAPLVRTQTTPIRIPAAKQPVKEPKVTEPQLLRPVIKQEQPAQPLTSKIDSTFTKKIHGTHPAPADKHKNKSKTASGLSTHQLTTGLIYKTSTGKQLINILDMDMTRANLQVVPVLASDSFNKLQQVKQQAQKVKALAAINANYFKKDGTPLGALIKDSEWISGPIYQRTAIGITADGRVLVDQVKLQGTLETSNHDLGSLNIDSINQPRIHGTRIVAYTPRWGSSIHMPYAGVLIAVDSHGKVTSKSNTNIPIPAGGFVLSDKKASVLSKLQIGDTAHISWHATPDGWSDVVQAVSGGPVLIHEGKITINCRNEKFPASWSGTGIKARTVIGVTRQHHIIMATLEGKHTLNDAARLLQSLGASEALNLDGGGSTTMIVAGQTVTRNRRDSQQRSVATSLAIIAEPATTVVRHKTTTVSQSSLAAIPR